MSEKFKEFMLEYPLAEMKTKPFKLAEAYGYLKALANTTEDKKEIVLCNKLQFIILTEAVKIAKEQGFDYE